MENNNLYLQMLDEAYYGKTPDLLEIEKKIGEIRQKYKPNPSKVNSARERERNLKSSSAKHLVLKDAKLQLI